MKLVLAGEYAVLDAGSPGIVAAVDLYVTCHARPIPEGVSIVAPALGAAEARAAGPPPTGALRFEVSASGGGGGRLGFARSAAEVAFGYVAELGLVPSPLELRCESDEPALVAGAIGRTAPAAGGAAHGLKLGLGTSAAVTAAVTGAVLAAHGVPIDRPVFRRHLFRLALTAHARAQGGRGSGIDVAASTYGGLLEYTRVDAGWLRRIERAGSGPLEVARGAWPALSVDPLTAPRGTRLLVGFTGRSASTVDLVTQVEVWRRENQAEYETFTRLSQRAARGLAAALRKGDRTEIVANIALARKALGYLGTRAGLAIETPPLERLATIAFEAGGAGKLSGAGGGDCGFAIAFDEPTALAIHERWRDAGIIPVAAGIAPAGLEEVRGEGAA